MKTRKTRAVSLTALLLILALSATGLTGCSEKMEGSYYDATAPDTLDLEERAALAVKGLVDILNPNADYAPYGSAAFGNSDVSYQSDWGDVIQAILMGRNMSGSDYNLKTDDKSIKGLKNYLASDNVKNDQNTLTQSTGQLALISQYALKPASDLKKLLDEMSQRHLDIATSTDDTAYDIDGEWQDDMGHGVIGYGENLLVNGTALRAILSWASYGDNTISAELKTLSEKYKNYLTLSKFWVAEATPKVVVDEDRGHFNGDMSAYASGLLGLLTYAEFANDYELQRFVQASYEYIRDYGLKSIGLFGDICTTSKMTQLAIKLSQLGVSDYWDDAERYLRNEIAEKQIPATDGDYAAAAGLFFTDSSYPTHIASVNQVADPVCTAQAVQAMYAAWQAIVDGDAAMAQVNMLLNRSSDLLDVNSFLPYEGKVELKVKSAEAAAVRIPLWVDWSQIAVDVNGAAQTGKRTGQYLVINGLAKDDIVTITFPLKEWDESYTLLWRDGSPYIKSTDPGEGWRAQPDPDTFTLTFRGYTVVGIALSNGTANNDPANYPLYQREAMKNAVAPTKTVRRFIPKVTF